MSPAATMRRPDDADKTLAFPAVTLPTYAGGVLPELGQRAAGIPVTHAAWWQDFAWWARQEFVRRSQMQGPAITNVAVSANNGAGDSAGIGTLTLTISTS